MASISHILEELSINEMLPADLGVSLGAIPKQKVKEVRTLEEKESKEAEDDNADVKSSPSTPLTSKKNTRKQRKNRQRQKQAAAEKVEEEADNDENSIEEGLESRIPELPIPPVMLAKDSAVKAAYAATGGGVAEKKAGSRKGKKVGKKRKPSSPPESEKEVADINSIHSDGDDDSDRKFHWRNVTKNGSIKKCVLVDGKHEMGRPVPGDVVLVKSQGKLKDGTIIDDYPTLVFHVGDYEVIEGLDLVVQSMFKNELSIISIKPEMAYGGHGRKNDVPPDQRITYLFGLLHFEKSKDIKSMTWAQRRKSGQSRMRLANWWYQRKEYPIAVKCYKKALQFYNDIPTNQECSTPEEYKELLQLMEERLRVMRQVASIFKRIANLIQSGQIET